MLVISTRHIKGGLVIDLLMIVKNGKETAFEWREKSFDKLTERLLLDGRQ